MLIKGFNQTSETMTENLTTIIEGTDLTEYLTDDLTAIYTTVIPCDG